MVRYVPKTCMGCRGSGVRMHEGEQVQCALCSGTGTIQERVSEPVSPPEKPQRRRDDQ